MKNVFRVTCFSPFFFPSQFSALPRSSFRISISMVWRLSFESCCWLMLLSGSDKNRAVQAAERLQAKLRERGDAANEDKLSLLKSVLQSPLFSQILTLQTSIQQLKDQVRRGVCPPEAWIAWPRACKVSSVFGKAIFVCVN